MDRTQKHLAIFLHGLYEGGAERIVLNMAKEMAKCGYSVDLVLASASGPFLSQIPKEIRLIDLQSSRVLFSLKALANYLRQEQPDALLSGIDYTNIIAILAHRTTRLPGRLVVVEHNTFSQRVHQMPFFYRLFLPRLIHLFYPWADSIVAVSRGVANDLAKTTHIKRSGIQIIYNPIITQEIIEKSYAPFEHPWFQNGQPPVLVSIGRLNAQKDFPTLLQAFSQVRQQQTARLVILGEGEDRPALEKLVDELGLSDQVSMPGFIDNPYPYLRHAAVFVLSSKWEGLPTVLVEALFCEVPIVSTDCPSGPREILKDGLFGKLVPVGDSEQLALALQDALDGKTPIAPPDSWSPFTVESALAQYHQVLFPIA